MNVELVKDLLMFLLPGGAIGSVVTWFATRRERKMGSIQKLLETIEEMVKKYDEVLDENVQLKADNAQLLANQRVLELKIDHLTEMVNRLSKQKQPRKAGQGAAKRSESSGHYDKEGKLGPVAAPACK